MVLLRKKKRKKSLELSPDEIFLDSKNLPGFDRNQMEGRLVMPVSRRIAFFIFLFFTGIIVIMVGQLWNLQVLEGEIFRKRAFFNSFDKHIVLPERGVIYDRNGKEIAWNEARFNIVLSVSSLPLLAYVSASAKEQFFPNFSLEETETLPQNTPTVVITKDLFWEEAEQFIEAFPEIPFQIEASSIRSYIDTGGFSHILGYVGRVDEHADKGDMKVGKTGVEKYFNQLLRGTEGVRFVETDAKGNIISESLQEEKKNGQPLTLTLDADLQSALYSSIGRVVLERGFRGGAGIVYDLTTGEILAMTSFPEFDSNEFSRGISAGEFSRLVNDERAPFFFRAIEGTYLPGSVFKPIVALAALNEGIILPDTQIFSPGKIIVPNPFFPDQPSIFLDWKAHGWTDMRHAIAVSSNVYFYSVGGGYENQKGVGAGMIEKYARMFGFGEPVFDGIEDKGGKVPHPEGIETWRVGDTYNFSIGQGGLQVTPIQMARYIGMLAKNGKVPLFRITKNESDTLKNHELADAALPQEYFDIIQEGMRLAVQEGTAQALSGFSISFAGKTGTAEIGHGRVNSWFMGYGPFDNPKLAFVVVMEDGSEKNLVGAASAMSEFMRILINTHSEYLEPESE